MNIAFDVDGVFTDIEKFQLKVGSEFFKKKYNKEIINENGYGIKEVFDCTDDQEIEFWVKKTFQYMKDVKPRVGTSATLKKLKKESHQIYIISSRAMCANDTLLGRIMRKLMIHWLDKNDIIYDHLIFCSVENSAEDKLNACLNNNIDIIVEDNKENINTICPEVQTLCFTTKNNKEYVNDSVILVNHFDDVYTKINELQNNSHFKILSSFERCSLKGDELVLYYQQLRNYYYNLPFDCELSKTKKRQCLRLLKILQPIFNNVYNPVYLNDRSLSSYHGVIFASNHLHAFDPLMLTSNGITDFRLLAKDELTYHKIGKLFEYIGAIFIDNDDPVSIQVSKNELIKAVLHGYNVMMFPEGTRNRTNKDLLDFKYGAVSTAQITGVPIIPCALNANYQLRSSNLFVNIGSPMYIRPEDSLEYANSKLKTEILRLLNEIKEKENNQKTKVK